MVRKTCSVAVLLFALLLHVCQSAGPVEVGRSPISNVGKALNLVRLYANPFVWIGTPPMPTWAKRRRDQIIRNPVRKRYRWAIEVDADNRWWITVYERDPNNPKSSLAGRRTLWTM